MSTRTAPLTLAEFNAPGINLNLLGLDPANPHADRVRDGLAALRAKSPTRATTGPVSVRQRHPGLTAEDAKIVAHNLVHQQLTAAIGIDGKKVALEVAVRLADALDVFHGYFDMLDAVPLDLSDVASYVDARTWAATPRHIREKVEQFALAERTGTLKHIQQETASLMAMLNEVDNIGGVALELFERRRMQRQGIRPRAIDKAIEEMKADGRIPQKGGPQQ